MAEQHVAVHLLEGVHTAREAFGLEQAVTIGGVKCRAMLPVQGRRPFFLAGPSISGGNQDPGWPRRIWGEAAPRGGIIRAVGIIPVGTTVPPGDKHIAFDHAAARWRQFLRAWLAVAAEGPTDYGEGYYGATAWASSEYDDEEIVGQYEPPQRGLRHPPQLSSAWAWCHALGHASAGDHPPLARALMTTAIRAGVVADWRVAIIDAATATEVALTAGLAALSPTLQSSNDRKRITKTRMLGPLLNLARDLGLPLPPQIDEDLKDPRNAVVHEGKEVSRDQARAAIRAAWAVVHNYDPLPGCCREPAPREAFDANTGSSSHTGG